MINLINYLRNYLFIAICIFVFSSNIAKADEKEMIIVLDTSLSMIGQGGKNIMPQVKEGLYTFIDKLDDGDTITFATFDTKVKIYPKVVVDDDNDRRILKGYISMVEAQGMWTHTYKMMDAIKAYVETLETDEPDVERELIILTDALDDPPPANRRNKLDIKEIADRAKDLSAYTYIVNLGKRSIKKDASGRIRVINAGDDVKAGVDAVQADIEKRHAINPYIIVIIIVLLLLFLLWFLQRRSRQKVFGMIDYYDHSLPGKEITTIDLTRFNMRKLSMGNNPSDNIKLRDYKSNKSVVLKAVGFGGVVKVQIDEKEGTEVEFLKNKKESFLEDGDTFKVDTYTCTYRNSK